MIPVSRTLAKFDTSVVNWLAVPHAAASGMFTLTVTALVWPSTPRSERRRMRAALISAFPKSVLWGIVEDQGDTTLHYTQDVRLKVRVVTYRGAK